MAIRKILYYPDQRLRIKAEPITNIDANIKVLAEDMLETMYNARGGGLAATQIDVPLRIVVMDWSKDRSEPMIIINPEIIERRGETESEEGCLSVPGTYGSVQRAKWVKVQYLDLDGNLHEEEHDGIKAICFQHEIEHLDGIVFVDHLSLVKQQRARKKIEKLLKRNL